MMVPSVKFNNDRQIPILGLGTWQSKPGEVTQAVKDAIDAGYRHFDCAHLYGNEKEVGDAVRAKIKEGVIRREDIFITSKLWNTHHAQNLVEPALRNTLKNLTTDYVDLYLIHWPTAFKEGDEFFPIKDGKIEFSDADYLETWQEMEKLCKKGLAKSIGVSNFNREQIERLLAVASIVPVTNQVECHPYLNQKKLMDFCAAKGITLTAYSPLGSPDRPMAKPGDVELLKDPVIVEIATRLGKNPGQILIRYQIQRGVIVIPKSVTKSRIVSNFDVFDFNLSDGDMAKLNGLNKGFEGRYIKVETFKDHKDYPFHAEY